MPFGDGPLLGRLVDAAARVVDQYIDVSVLLDRGSDQALTPLGVGDVGRDHECPSADVADRRSRLFEQLGSARREHHVGAVLREHLSGGPADAGTAARDDRHSSLEREHLVHHHSAPSCCTSRAWQHRGDGHADPPETMPVPG